MPKEDLIVLDGKIKEVLQNRMCNVEVMINNTPRVILAFMKSCIDKKRTKLSEGDLVSIEISKYDPDKAKIIEKKKK